MHYAFMLTRSFEALYYKHTELISAFLVTRSTHRGGFVSLIFAIQGTKYLKPEKK